MPYSVRNDPWPLQGPTAGLARALDGTGWQNVAHIRPGSLRTVAIVEDGGSCNARQISAGDCRGQPGNSGDCGGTARD